MSEKVKMEYNKYAADINPSPEFLARLTATLEEEQAKQKRSKFRWVKPVSAVAACFAVVAVGAVIATKIGSKPQLGTDTPATSVGIMGNADAIQTAPFQSISWYDDTLSSDSLAAALAEKLTGGLDYLAYNSENKFVGAEHADTDTVQELSAMLAGAAETADAAAGDTVYYMAVFNDGTVAKFSVTAERYVMISGSDGVFEIG